MPKFTFIVQAPENIRKQSYQMDQFYYKIDSADETEVRSWVDCNPFIVTHAVIGQEHFGYFNLMPITAETADLLDRQEIQEEELTEKNMLTPNVMQHAKYFYLPAITVKNFKSYKSRCCVAALLSGLASHLLTIYDIKNIKRIYANPTTFEGNHMVRKLGLIPVKGFKKPLKSSDVYALSPQEGFADHLAALEKRYQNFIAENCWRDPKTDWPTALRNFIART